MTEKQYITTWKEMCEGCHCHYNGMNAVLCDKCFHPDNVEATASETTCPRLKSMPELERVEDVIGIETFKDGIGLDRVDVYENETVCRVKNRADGMGKCQRTIVDKNWTGHRKRKCERVATHKQDDGLPLCERHYNKCLKKIERSRGDG